MFTNDLVAMATSLEKSENKVMIHHLHVKRFHMVKRLQKSVQYIRRYSTKYAEPREHATQFSFVSLFSAETTGPIVTIFSPYESALRADDGSLPYFPISQGTLPW